MVIFKAKKNRAPSTKAELRVTIDAKHNRTINAFNEKESTLKKKYDLLNSLHKEYTSFCERNTRDLSSSELERKLVLYDKITDLEKYIKSIENKDESNKYLLNTSQLLYYYYDSKKYNNKSNQIVHRKDSIVDMFMKTDNKDIKSIDKKIDKKIDNKKIDTYTKTDILNKYMMYSDKTYIYNVHTNKSNINYCVHCNIENIYIQTESTMICPTCGLQTKILVDSDKPSYKEPPREISYFAYKRINHFNEWLAQFQAKESTDIPKSVYKLIKKELNKEPHLNINNLKVNKIRDILKKLGLNKYYEHVPHIINRLSGKPAPIINRNTEEKLRMMFKEIQTPWINHCPNKRSNFLSYSYVLFKCLQLLEMDTLLKHFSLLKSREKLAEQDKIWKQICNDLKWQYIKTI